MEKTFKLEIVTPYKVLFNGDVVSFTAPGVLGGFQVLYNHAPMLAQVGVGEVKLKEPNGSEVIFATSGGFVDVLDNFVTLLAETAERADEIDKQRAEISRDEAKQKLTEKLSELEYEQTKLSLDKALNRIRVAEKR